MGKGDARIAGAATTEVTPGTTSKGISASNNVSDFLPPPKLPKTKVLPPLSLQTISFGFSAWLSTRIRGLIRSWDIS